MLGLIVGLIVTLFYAVVFIGFGALAGKQGLGFGLAASGTMLLLVPAGYAILCVFTGVLHALLVNIALSFSGGLEIEID